MSAKAKFNVSQVTGTYKNDSGEDKTSYQNLGVVFENEKGHLDMKLNALPLPNAKGEVWVKLFEINK